MIFEAERTALSDTEREEIQRQMDHICSHASFRQSDRSIRLLRYLVKVALESEFGHLKERVIGHEVFGRPASYETSSDPIVRNAASEVRKRLAQYYQSPDHQSDIRIVVVPGSYTPEFQFRPAVADAPPSMPPADIAPKFEAPANVAVAADEPVVQKQRRVIRILCAVIAAMLCLQVAVYVWHVRKADVVSRFWSPLLSTDRDTVISVGHRTYNNASLPSTGTTTFPFVMMADASAYASVAGVLDAHNRKFRMMTADTTGLSDLRNHPTILIGGFNNPWTLRLTSGMRYRFGKERPETGPQQMWIDDAKSAHPRWELRWKPNLKDWTVDYALAGRVHDPLTGQITYFAAGVGPYATAAAAAFLTQEQYLVQLPRSLSNPNANIELVLKVDVLDGTASVPRIEAMNVW